MDKVAQLCPVMHLLLEKVKRCARIDWFFSHCAGFKLRGMSRGCSLSHQYRAHFSEIKTSESDY